MSMRHAGQTIAIVMGRPLPDVPCSPAISLSPSLLPSLTGNLAPPHTPRHWNEPTVMKGPLSASADQVRCVLGTLLFSCSPARFHALTNTSSQ